MLGFGIDRNVEVWKQMVICLQDENKYPAIIFENHFHIYILSCLYQYVTADSGNRT